MEEKKCKICGCTEHNACTNPKHGNCWWVDFNQDLCSHCHYEQIKNDPDTVHRAKLQTQLANQQAELKKVIEKYKNNHDREELSLLNVDRLRITANINEIKQRLGL